MTSVAALNGVDRETAFARLLDCCGSRRWARALVADRPYANAAALAGAALRAFDELAREDWLEAFAAHPRIGHLEGAAHAGAQSGRGETWSKGEQALVRDASPADREALAEGNRRYVERFGYSFIVCATGKTAGELRAILEQRLANAPAEELEVAAVEQRRITRLRLDKMLAG